MENESAPLTEPPGEVQLPATRVHTVRVRPDPSVRLTRMVVVMTILAAIWIMPALVRRIQYASEYGKQQARMDVALVGLEKLNLEDLSTASRLVAQALRPSVVEIRTERELSRQELRQLRASGNGAAEDDPSWSRGHGTIRQIQGEGSGVIVDADGFVVTNHHVIDGASRIEVRLSDGRQVPATVVGIDAKTDLAVLKIPGGDLAAAKWGDSETLGTGDMVWAFGSPFGLDHSVTFGIVSAKGRPGIRGHSQFQDLLQTDVAVNPGNSGGPLVNVRGEIVGINTAIAGRDYRGVSFAIPSRIAQNIYQRLKTKGKVARGFLGVGLQELTPEIAEQLGLKQIAGVLVTGVLRGSPARQAGLQEGDLIIAWNGKPVVNSTSLSRLIAATEIGSRARLKLIRGGRPLEIAVVVDERPAQL